MIIIIKTISRGQSYRGEGEREREREREREKPNSNMCD